ncbi:Gfo/Idh/MocA family protein [Stakelama tenebrarum]|uniref:Gfo/Idh/MocA family oxidoreductase n=1 Tax=Stakelama tenebrarum TaxID=2711215 RepID=A0A6G6Y5J6_9SPHN|nr:Gfo/Idh/MocA family oxidoreductase [Sphingosinithalassobacter tenebrarum]QIG80224.1 Gfo/Idh/MocA family oxidoreductase [Sphingosinithalassobacter tenebrarum]
MSGAIRLAVIGLGKIARDQHLPAIASSDAFELVATVSRDGARSDGIPHFEEVGDLAESNIGVDAVSVCTPPQVRRAVAQAALARGWHVLLEKPPAATLGEAEALRDLACARETTLFASWHSRHAAGVAPARAWLADREIRSVRIAWREDVRVWHPGQAWIWQPGGFGVFDPGINALSIITHILPRPLFVTAADLEVPENCAAPIAGTVSMCDSAGVNVAMELDFLQQGPQSWDIAIETDAGTLRLAKGGAEVSFPDGRQPPAENDGEYPALYAHYAELIRAGESDVDLAPLRIVADAFLKGRHRQVAAFIE